MVPSEQNSIRIQQIQTQVEIRSEELCPRAQLCPLTDTRVQFVASYGSDQVGFMSLDLHMKPELVIYDLWIVEHSRRTGVGTELVSRAVQYAREYGFREILVLPRPTAFETVQEKLIEWYEEQGFRQCASRPELYSKRVK